MIEHTDAGMQGPVAAPSIIFGTIAATIHGPAGGPWEAVHPDPPPAKGNGAAINLDDIPDFSLGEDWCDDGHSKEHVEPYPISAEAYFDLTDEEKREVARDAVGRPDGYWKWPKEAWNRYGRENPRTPNAGPPRKRLEVNSEAFFRDRPQQGEQPPRIITLTPYVWHDPATLPMRQWLYGRHYIRKFISATLAAGGLGKSSLGLVEAIAMGAKINLLDVPVPNRLRVAYWGEDPADEIERRIGAILKHFKISREQIEGWLFADSFRTQPLRVASLEKGAIVFPDADTLTKALIASRIDVLILDPFVKTHGVSENDNAAIDLVARKFNDIAGSAECSIELLHHVRKASGFGRAEVTADDGRGASSLKDAARCVRVCNRMSEADAQAAQVKEKDRKRYFRVDDDGKANMTAPAEGATWFKLISVPLVNDVANPNAQGDEIGVVISWHLPGVFAGLSTNDLPKVQADIERGGPWARDVQNKEDWAGIAIAQTLDLDLTDKVVETRVKNLLAAWIESGALKVTTRTHPKRKDRVQKIVVVGNRVEGNLFDET